MLLIKSSPRHLLSWVVLAVISDVPNVYERLKNEGIEFATITAGKYKRTITPTKKITKEDLIKTTKDIEDVLTLFKGFVSTNRPSLNIDEVATGGNLVWPRRHEERFVRRTQNFRRRPFGLGLDV